MIRYKNGNILEEEAEALVNTVNCVGVMGRGVALQFKNSFPENFKVYAAACKKQELQPGKMFIYPTGQLTMPRYIVNFPTKRHWRGKSRIEDIESGLVDLRAFIQEQNIRSIALPPLGAGLGGLDWQAVKQRIEQGLNGLNDVEIIVFEPRPSTQQNSSNASRDVPKMTPGRAALVSLVDRYLAGLMDPFISLLEVHKLMYFLQEAGEPLKLKYTKNIYGPYAQNLRHVLNAIEGHMLSGYINGGDDPKKQLKLVPKALQEAREFLQNEKSTQAHIKKVSDLVDGFESPFGLELLATVHWVLSKQSPRNQNQLVREVHAWNNRKHIFSPRQIRLSADVLANKGWCKPIAEEQA